MTERSWAKPLPSIFYKQCCSGFLIWKTVQLIPTIKPCWNGELRYVQSPEHSIWYLVGDQLILFGSPLLPFYICLKISRSKPVHQKSTCPMASMPNWMDFLANWFRYIDIYPSLLPLCFLEMVLPTCLFLCIVPLLALSMYKPSVSRLNFRSGLSVILHLLSLTNVFPEVQSNKCLCNLFILLRAVVLLTCLRDTCPKPRLAVNCLQWLHGRKNKPSRCWVF